MRLTRLLAVAALVALAAVPAANARPNYVPVMLAQYGLQKDPAALQANCQYCHVNAFGGAPWNRFGDALRATFTGAAARRIDQALYLVLRANEDSDGDGFEDVLEVVARTLPGDARSKPKLTRAALQARLKGLGGFARFKPRAAAPAAR